MFKKLSMIVVATAAVAFASAALADTASKTKAKWVYYGSHGPTLLVVRAERPPIAAPYALTGVEEKRDRPQLRRLDIGSRPVFIFVRPNR